MSPARFRLTRLLPSLLVLALGCKDEPKDGGDATKQPETKSALPDPSDDDGEPEPAPSTAAPPDDDGGVDDGGEIPAPAAELAPPAELTADVATLVDALGDRALLTFVLRPSKWADADKGLKATLSTVPDPGVAALATSKSLVDALMAIGKLAVGKDFTVLKGYDPTKPIVGALFEPPLPDLAADPLSVVDLTQSRATRHAILIPVTDGKAFVESAEVLFGADKQPNWIEGEGPAWTARVPNVGYIAVGIEGDYARLTVLSEAEDVPPDKAKALLRPRLRPVVTAPVDTPALQELVAGDGVVAINLRPWRIAELATFHGSHVMARALEFAPPESKSMMLAAGLAAVLSAELYVTGTKPEFDDWTYTLRTSDDAVSIAAVASLTPHGRTLWDAAKTEVTALPVKAKDPIVEGFVRLDALKMLDAAEPHAAFDPKHPDRAFETFMECGMFCPLHAMHGAPVQLVDTMVGAAPMPGGIPPLVVLQGAMTSVDPPAAAVAGIFGTAAGAGRAETLAKSLGGPDVVKALSISQQTRGAQSVLMGGWEAKPKAVFDVGSRPSDALLYVAGTANGPAFPKYISGMSAGLQIDRHDTYLVVQAAIGSGGVPKLDYAPDHSGVTWTSPILAYPGADDAKCVLDAAKGVTATFSAVALVEASKRAEVIEAGLAEIKDAFECKDGTPEVRARAQHLEHMMKALVAELSK